MDSDIFKIKHYDYTLPEELIAQKPAVPRDSSALLVVNRQKAAMSRMVFSDIGRFLAAGDVLVLNNTEVIRARLSGENSRGKKIEVLLLKEKTPGLWEVLVRPGKAARLNDIISFNQGKLSARIVEKTESGSRLVLFDKIDLENILEEIGIVPLPPYIEKDTGDPNDYQTVYAAKRGAVAAPTAGLHFTKPLLGSLVEKGVIITYVTLHCGLATFRPIKVEDVRRHKIDSEWIEIPTSAVNEINAAKQNKRRVIGVGTTAIRTLESRAFLNSQGIFQVSPFSGETDLFITPGYNFKIIDAVISNFHTPRSTNLVLMAAFMGLGLTKKSYMRAREEKFRFFSFGDAMFIE
jgi:S-adenosylmethionine:tRNA ribosyltransferase-isomerase